ncbi:MAG: hypothetical protein ABF569_14055 [Acetobacter sp.]|jgi:hypothetical protein|uniref:hypothetical protein n=1 Tax=Acetobacteraceae TaxID=433 RepID=UPI0039E85DA7
MSKTLDQRIADAEAKLTRLRQQERKLDTGRKIVLGGIIMAGAENDPAIRQWLLAQIEQKPLRKEDAERLAPLIEKWKHA